MQQEHLRTQVNTQRQISTGPIWKINPGSQTCVNKRTGIIFTQNKSEYKRLKLHAVIHMYKTYETHAKLQYLYNGEEIHFVLKKIKP